MFQRSGKLETGLFLDDDRNIQKKNKKKSMGWTYRIIHLMEEK